MSNDRYKILRKISDVFINDIPIIVNEIILSEDLYTNKKLIKTKIKNIGLNTVSEVKLLLEFLDNKGKVKEKIQFIYENIELRNNYETELEINIEFKNIDLNNDVKVIVSEMEIENAETTNKETVLEKHNEIDILSNWGDIGEQYKREVYSIANKQVNIKNKYEKLNKIWHCTCGNYCFENIDICPNCNIKKDELEKIANEDYLKVKLEEYKKKQAEIKEKTIKEAKKIGNKTLKIVIIIAIAVILGILVFFIRKDIMIKNMIKNKDFDSAVKLSPNLYEKYSKYIYRLADEYANENNIIEEYSILNATENYAKQYNIGKDILDDSFKNRYIDVSYKYFVKQYENKNYKECYSLLEFLQNSEKYKDDEILLKASDEIKYNVSIDLMKSQEYEGALNLLNSINENYEGRKEQITEAKYLRGVYLFEGKNYSEANKYFKEMLDYKEAKNKYREGIYYLTKEKFEKYKEEEKTNTSDLKAILADFEKAENFNDAANYISEINDALKWHGDWKCQNNKYMEDVKIDYFNKKIRYLERSYTFTIDGNRLNMYFYNTERDYAVLNNDILTVYDDSGYFEPNIFKHK